MSIQRSSAIIFTPGKVLEAAIDPDAIPDPAVAADTPLHALAWTTNIKVRPVDHDTVEWDAGSVEFSDDESQVVSASGSPKTLDPAANAGVWYAYKRFTSSTIQFTQNFATAVGTNRIQLGIIVVTATSGGMATVLIKGDDGGPHISAQSIAVNVLSALTANLGEVTAGTMTGVLIRTSASGKRVQLSSADSLDFFDSSGVKVGDLDVTTIAQDPMLHLLLRAIGSTRQLSLVSDKGIALYPEAGASTPGDFSLGAGVVGIDGNLFVDAVTLLNNALRLAGNDIESVGDVELDSLTKDGSGAIQVNSDIDFNRIVELGLATELLFEGNEVTDIGTDALRAANLWANAAILDAMALRENQTLAAQAGRSVLFIDGAGANAQLKIIHSDGTIHNIPGAGGGGGELEVTEDVDFGGFDALDVGEVQLDSLRKDGSGRISVGSILELAAAADLRFVSHEVTDIGTDSRRARKIWASEAILNALTLRDGQDFAAQTGRTVIYVEGSGADSQVKIRYPNGSTADLPGSGSVGGELLITDNVDFGGYDALQVGELELDSLVKDGAGSIAIEDTVEFGSSTEVHFEGHELTDIGTDTRRMANLWGNAAILDALALRDGQDVAAQAGRTIIYVEGSGSTRQVKIRYPDGTTADLPGEPGEPADPVTSLAGTAVTLDPTSFGGNLPIGIDTVQKFADAVDNFTLGSSVQLPPDVYLWASTESATPGASVTLFWFTVHADYLDLNQGIGSVSPVLAGSIVVNPTETTFYRAIAGAIGIPSDTSSLLVVISGVAPDDPVIDSFTIDDLSVAPGVSTNLRWETTDATEVTITADISGEAPSGTLDLDGNIEVSPGEAVTYTLSARNSAQVVVTAQVSVSINYVVTVTPERLLIADGDFDDRLWEIDPDGSDTEGTILRGLPVNLTSPTGMTILNESILIVDGAGDELWGFHLDADDGTLLRDLPSTLTSPLSMTVFEGRLLIADHLGRELWEIDPDGSDTEGTILRILPSGLLTPHGMTVFEGRLLIADSSLSDNLWEIDPDGSDTEGTILRDLPSTLTHPTSMTVFEGRLLIVHSTRRELWEIDPDGSDTEGTILRILPSDLLSPGGMTVLPPASSDVTPRIDEFSYDRSGATVTFTWRTTYADEVRLQVSGTDNPGSYADIVSNLNPDGTNIRNIGQSSSLYWRIRAINNEGPTTYSDGLVPS